MINARPFQRIDDCVCYKCAAYIDPMHFCRLCLEFRLNCGGVFLNVVICAHGTFVVVNITQV